MRKLVESTFVTLDGTIGAPQEWGPPYFQGGLPVPLRLVDTRSWEDSENVLLR